MGTYDNGAFGSFHGRVGNLVGSSWKGINYMKARPNTGQRKSSEKQIYSSGQISVCSRICSNNIPDHTSRI